MQEVRRAVPVDNMLEVVRTWAIVQKQFAWTVVCRCGNAQLLLVGDYGARCHNCSAYPSREAYQRASDTARKRAAFDDLPIAKTEQMMKPDTAPPRILGSDGRVRPLSGEMLKRYKALLPRVRPKLTGAPIQHSRKIKLVSVIGGNRL